MQRWPPEPPGWPVGAAAVGGAVKRRRPAEQWRDGAGAGAGDGGGVAGGPGGSLSSAGSDPDDTVGHLIAGPGDRIADRWACAAAPALARATSRAAHAWRAARRGAARRPDASRRGAFVGAVSALLACVHHCLASPLPLRRCGAV